MNNCIFCKYSNEKNDRVLFDSQLFFCLLDIKPVSFGHSLVIPKRHVVNFLDLTAEESKELLLVSQKLIEYIKKNKDIIYKVSMETAYSSSIKLIKN